MNNDTLCVIGVSGFIGSHVAAELLRQGCSVHGTLRDPTHKRDWLQSTVGALAHDGRELKLFAADLQDRDTLAAAMEGCSGVVMSAGTEAQSPKTVSLMLAAAENTLKAAQRVGIQRVVFTSSTGSTNPPDGEPPLKRELEHWSDADQQIAVEKFSPAAKTLMERLALALGDRLGIRVSILNPSLILGPAYQPDPPSSLRFLASILAGERMADHVPDGSMSIIDVRDLARLHVAALEDPNASGRYFGVRQSWHWADILTALGRVRPTYTAPTWPDAQERSEPTGYDLTRQKQLGVTPRDLDAILTGAVEELERRGLL